METNDDQHVDRMFALEAELIELRQEVKRLAMERGPDESHEEQLETLAPPIRIASAVTRRG